MSCPIYVHVFGIFIDLWLLLPPICYIGVRSRIMSAEGSKTSETAETPAVVREQQVVRMSRHPPPRFSEKKDLPL